MQANSLLQNPLDFLPLREFGHPFIESLHNPICNDLCLIVVSSGNAKAELK